MFHEDCEHADGFGWRGRGPFGPGFGGFRAGRGMMEPAILQALQAKPMHGYEIISTLEEKSHGMWRPSPGSVYPTLQLLEEKDLVTSEEKDGKKVYRLTAAGQQEAAQSADLFERLREHRKGRGRDFHEAAREFKSVMHLAHAIYHEGDEAQKRRVLEQIKQFKLALEQIKKDAA